MLPIPLSTNKLILLLVKSKKGCRHKGAQQANMFHILLTCGVLLRKCKETLFKPGLKTSANFQLGYDHVAPSSFFPIPQGITNFLKKNPA